ncbi:MAG: hypothetical protein ACR2JZ_05075 [Candidatus Limnocylindrales bacterium]
MGPVGAPGRSPLNLEDGPAAARRHSTLTLALACGGVAFTALQRFVGAQTGLFPVPGGEVLIWDRVGDGVRAGAPIYYRADPLTDSYWYAPPLAVAFAALSWLPPEVQHWLYMIPRIAALRVIAGSWIGAGVACWFPLVAFDIAGGNFNLPIAAAIVAAVRGHPQLAVLAGLAKFGPALAIHPRDWRKALPVLAIACAITLPWLHLWPEWIAHLVSNIASPLGPQIPIPLSVRLAAAAGLLLLVRTRWSRALAATIAIPAFYWGSLVVLIAPVAVAIRDRSRSARESPVVMAGTP